MTESLSNNSPILSNSSSDNGIIKALECFALDKDFDGSQCIGCAFEHQFCTANMSVDIAKPALDLINRLQARVEKCEKVEHFADKSIATLQAENKRLSTLAELGNKRADDYRVMRDRALKAEKEVERLQGIVLSFAQEITTCGNKNNIDTTVFSMIPILETEQDNIVKRLKADIKTTDWLIKDIPKEQLEKERIQALKGEIKRLQEMLQDLYTAVPIGNNKKFANELQKIKADAYKEFAERLKEKTLYSLIDSEYNCVYVSEIDNLLKELVGEDNNSPKNKNI